MGRWGVASPGEGTNVYLVPGYGCGVWGVFFRTLKHAGSSKIYAPANVHAVFPIQTVKFCTSLLYKSSLYH